MNSTRELVEFHALSKSELNFLIWEDESSLQRRLQGQAAMFSWRPFCFRTKIFSIKSKKKDPQNEGLFCYEATVTLPFFAVAASSLSFVDEPVRIMGLGVLRKHLS